MKLLKRMIEPSVISIFAIAIIFNIIEGISRILLAGNTGSMINAVTDHLPESLQMLLIYGLIYGIILMVSIFIKEACFARALERTLANIRKGLFDELISLDLLWIKKRNTNELAAGISNDLNSLTDALRPWVVMTFSQLVMRLIYVVYTFKVDWLLALIILSLAFPLTWLQKLLVRPLKEYASRNQAAMGRLAATAGFCYQKREYIKACAVEEALFERFEEEQKLQYKSAAGERNIKALSQALGMLSGLITLLILFGVGSYMVIAGRISFGELIAFYALSNGVIKMPSGIAEFITDGQKLLVCLGRMEEVFNLPSEKQWSRKANDTKPSSDYAVEFCNVDFSYDNRILDNASFYIRKGETVLLTGSNGSGKSTLLALITGFYELDSGNIFLFGRDIYSMSKDELRSRICYIPQEPVLFFGTIYENATCFNSNISKSHVREILEKLGLGDTLHRLPEGIDSQVGEQGALLSGGERQRVLLARCFIREAELILLDEIGAGLEAGMEDMILSLIQQLPKRPAILYISHNQNAGCKADRIIRLEKGRVSAIDSSGSGKNNGEEGDIR